MNKTKLTVRRQFREVGHFLLGTGVGILLLIVCFRWVTRNEALPGVSVASFDVSLEDSQAIENKLNEKTREFLLTASYGESQFTIPTEMFIWNTKAAALEAVAVGKKVDLDVYLNLIAGRVNLLIPVEIEGSRYQDFAMEVNSYITIAPLPAKVLRKNGKNAIVNGDDGVVFDQEGLREKLIERAQGLRGEGLEIPTLQVKGRLSASQEAELLAIADGFEGKTLILKIDEATVRLSQEELISFLSVKPEMVGQLEEETINNYVTGLSERFNRVPQNAKLVFRDGKVEEFAPGREGIEVRQAETSLKIGEAISQLMTGESQKEVTIEINRRAPKIGTGEVNDLGIREKIGHGESYYAHSIANRIYNVALAAERVDGALIPPGEEFSFNETVGEISAETGYKTAYVISGGRTILGDGGGVCQVSTTLFRAVLDGGLPVTERWAHAYRVGYYEQNAKPGLDATVYSPSKDFKFKNDTPGHILIQAINDPKAQKLIFDFYGTKDARTVKISDPRLWGVTPPPPDLYQDDPTLSAGTVKQVDWAAWGGKAAFEYMVERDGETLFTKTFTSNYQPWQNVFLRGVEQVEQAL
ncbi:MAG: VanW family protein [Microgenomates group bacterium GW2011_GWF2_47_9]|nr:MAG: VanW family protein [Microgenomates group bacterium GW2011_GWF2_47_9]